MSVTKVLFLAGIISLTGYSMQDNCQVEAGTHVGRTSCDPVLGMPNPAAVYCTENGGRLEDRPSTRGADAVCVFENSECGQWAYKNGECEQDQCARWSTESNSCEVLLVDVSKPEDNRGDDREQVGITEASDCGPNCPTVGVTCDDECEDGCGVGGDEATVIDNCCHSDNASQSACDCGSGNVQAECGCCSQDAGQTDRGSCDDSPAQEGCDPSQDAPGDDVGTEPPVVTDGGCSN